MRAPGREPGAGERLYVRLLRLYPRGLRERFAPEMIAAFRALRAQPRYRGPMGRARFWMLMAGDLTRSLWTSWRRERTASPGWRDQRARGSGMRSFVQDVRFALRMLRHSRGFTAVAVLTLALGIGATTTIFGAVNAILLRELPFEAPERLVEVAFQEGSSVSKRELEQLRERQRSFAGVAGFSGWGVTLTGSGEPAALEGARVTGDFFGVLGVSAALGRTMRPEDTAPGAEPVAVLSHDAWESRFGGDTAVVGRALTLNGTPHVVIGVMPADVRFPSPGTALWLPAVLDPAAEDYTAGYLRLVGRLAPGIGVEAAAADVRAVAAALVAEGLTGREPTFGQAAMVEPLAERLVAGARGGLLLLLGAVGIVLVIACVNIANLLLGRTTRRERELSVRVALGAGRGRVTRQLLTESLVLGAGGGLLGAAAAWWGTRAFAGLLPPDLHGASEIRLDGAVLAFAIVATALSSLVAGALPAVRAAGGGVSAALRERARGSSSARGRRLQGWLAITQIALAVVLVAASGTMLQSFWRLRGEDTGYRSEGVIAMRISPSGAAFRDRQAVAAYWDRVLEAVRGVPGVEAAGGVHILPMSGNNWNPSLRVRGRPPADGREPEVYWRVVTPGYFETMGIPLIAGRGIEARDHATSAPVAVVNRTLAARMFPGEDPIGREIATGFEGRETWARIVGVVGDTRDMALDRAAMPQMYRPMAQWPVAMLALMVRTAGDATGLVPRLREAVWSVDDQVPIADVRPFEDVIAATAGRPRLLASLLSGFGAVALLMGAIGVFGVLSHAVAERRRELGIRIALGADRAMILRLVLASAGRLAAIGLVVGLAGAAAGGRVLAAQLYDTSPTDFRAVLAAAVLLGLTALAAAAIPARAATRVDPGETMRAD